MPAKNRIKLYSPDSYYHIYNRGVEKRITFVDKQDYVVFLYLLKLYLSPNGTINSRTFSNQTIRIKKVYYDEVELHAFCLMPNHFHLLIYQKDKKSITEFMRALTTSYVMYFNKKYKRVGSLFQGAYKATLITKDEYILHLSRYIHINPLKSFAGSDPAKLEEYPYSSYSYYLGGKHAGWVKNESILSMFGERKSFIVQSTKYKKFVEDYSNESDILPDKLLLEIPE